jgi:hypothetical protein
MTKKKKIKSVRRKNKHISHIHIIVLIVAILIGVFTYLLINIGANASNNSKQELDWEQQTTKEQCNVTGDQVISVNQKVINDIDSGQAGNYWAFDTFTREIKVWEKKSSTILRNRTISRSL